MKSVAHSYKLHQQVQEMEQQPIRRQQVTDTHVQDADRTEVQLQWNNELANWDTGHPNQCRIYHNNESKYSDQ